MKQNKRPHNQPKLIELDNQPKGGKESQEQSRDVPVSAGRRQTYFKCYQ